MLWSPRISGLKFVAPQTDRLVADDNPPLSQQIFNITAAQVEAMVEPNHMLNDLERKSVTFVKRGESIHPTIVV